MTNFSVIFIFTEEQAILEHVSSNLASKLVALLKNALKSLKISLMIINNV